MKILFVAEKPFVSNLFEKMLKLHKTEIDFSYSFAYPGHVFHKDDPIILNSNVDKTNLFLPGINIPEETYHVYGNSDVVNVKDYDTVISICDNDDYGILSFADFLEKNGIAYEDAEMILINTYTNQGLYDSFINNKCDFLQILDECVRRINKNNFNFYPSEDFNVSKIRALTGMSRREFCDYFDIPYRTLENWEKGTAACPGYLYNLMKYKLEQEGLIIG